MATLLKFWCFFQMVVLSMAYPGGAPIDQCMDMFPSHNVKDQKSVSPYQVIVSKLDIKGGDTVRVRLAAPTVPFKGFLAIGYKVRSNGVPPSGPPLTGTIASLIPANSNVQTLDCFGIRHSALTHKNASLKNNIEFDWMPPNEDGVFVILVTFVKDYKTFWLRVLSAEIRVTRDPNYFPEDEDYDEGMPQHESSNAFAAITKVMREQYYAGCDHHKGCFGFPLNCYSDPSPNAPLCHMFTSWKKLSNNQFRFQIAGRLPGWRTYDDTKTLTQGHVSSGLSHDKYMGSDSVIGCVFKNGKVQPKSYFNLPNTQQNSIFQNEYTGLVPQQSSGNYTNGYVMCEFTRTAYLEDTTREVGRNFDLLNDTFHIIMARAAVISVNKENGREKLGYHDGPEDKAVSVYPTILADAYTYKEPENGNQGGQHGGIETAPTLKPAGPNTTKTETDTSKTSSAVLTVFNFIGIVIYFGIGKVLA